MPTAEPPTLHILVHRRNIRRYLGGGGGSVALPEPEKPPAPRQAPRSKPPAKAPPLPPKPKKYLPLFPATRSECLPGGSNAQRPCLFASCRHSLLVDIDCDSMEVRETAEDPRKLPATCSLDVADQVDMEDKTVILRGLEGYFLFTRERIRQLEMRAINAFGEGLMLSGLDIPVNKVLRSPWGNPGSGKRRDEEEDEDD